MEPSLAFSERLGCPVGPRQDRSKHGKESGSRRNSHEQFVTAGSANHPGVAGVWLRDSVQHVCPAQSKRLEYYASLASRADKGQRRTEEGKQLTTSRNRIILLTVVSFHATNGL